jgi:hypothetical protein
MEVLMLVYIVQKFDKHSYSDWDNEIVCKTREQAVQYIKEHPNGDYWIEDIESEGF